MQKKNIIFSAVCLILFAAFCLLMVIAVLNMEVKTVSDGVKLVPVVVIDAGHGGEDGGAVSADGVLEKDINLSISEYTSDLLYLLGFEVKKTRSDDTALDTESDTVHARKVADLKKRLEIFESSKNNVIISIHQNKFSQTKYHGTQIFYSPNNEKSKLLAESIRLSVKNQLQPDNEREIKKADDGIYLLKNTQNPAVIVECGFISNDEECKKLQNEEYQRQISYTIATGFLEYISNRT